MFTSVLCEMLTSKAVEFDGGVESPELFLQLGDSLGQSPHLCWLLSERRSTMFHLILTF